MSWVQRFSSTLSAGTAMVLLMATLMGCADGGPVGSGIGSSALAGNVLEVINLDGSSSSAADEPVTVLVEGMPELTDTTDENGDFAISGSFSGAVALSFVTAEYSVGEAFVVPAGSTVILEDVQVTPGEVNVARIRVERFFGDIQGIACSATDAADLIVHDRRTALNEVAVKVTPDTVVVGPNGEDIGCTPALVDAKVVVEGVVRRDSETNQPYVLALVIVVNPPLAGQPRPIVKVSFSGVVTLINCEQEPASIFFVDDVIGEARLRLSAAASTIGDTQQAVGCADIQPGDRVEGVGFARSIRLEVIQVDRMRVLRPVETF
jgi:hypothetical protein